MGPGLAEYLHDAREQPLCAAAHVHWFDREPQGIDADHLSWLAGYLPIEWQLAGSGLPAR